MPKHTLTRLLGYIAVPTAATIYGTHLGLSHLEKKYPALPPSTHGSRALSTPENPQTQRCAYTDIYAARVPLHALSGRTRTPNSTERSALEDAWARTIVGSRILKAEASMVGLLRGHYSPGDTGATEEGFAPNKTTGAPRELLNGIFVVKREIAADKDSNGLLVAWNLPDSPRLFFEKIARWGYPWRLMSGGRHEMSISEPFEVQGQGKFIDVRFASAHDYEIVESEGPLEEQKIIPNWTMRLHRGCARLVLDVAARDLEKGR